MSQLKKVARRILPPHTPLGRYAKRTAAKVGLAKPLFFDEEYNKWINDVEPYMFLPIVSEESPNNKPLFSLVIPFFNTPEKYLHPLIDSIQNQVYQNWELIVADASTDKERSDAIKALSDKDSRFVYYKLPKNAGISGNTNQALEKVKGSYVVFADHDDILSPYALNEAAVIINDDNTTDVIYSDEDKITDNGKMRHSPYFKPDWSPHLFLYTNYTNHLSIIRSELVEKAGGLRPEFDGSQDYDLLLRVHTVRETPLNVKHIPKILYHWREAAGSTAVDYNRKSYAFDAGRRALQEFCDRKKLNAKVVSIKDTPGFFKQEFKIPEDVETVRIVTKASNNKRENEAFISKIKKVTVSNLKIDYSSTRTGLDAADIVVEINDTCLPVSPTWLNELVGVLGMADVATVSPRILTPDRRHIFDMGIVRGSTGSEQYLHKGLGVKDLTIGGGSLWVRDVDKPSRRVVAYRPQSSSQKKAKQHHVIWSHVDFVHYPVYGVATYFNTNLQVNADGRVTVNDK